MPGEAAQSEIRFLADGMLGKVSRWLRLLGCDVDYRPDVNDEELIELAKRSRRTLLTRDCELYRKAVLNGLDALLIPCSDLTAALASVVYNYNINIEINPDKSRCPTCNSQILKTTPEMVAGRVPGDVIRHHKDFWVCTNPECGKVYWKGSHWRNIIKTLHDIEKIKCR